jgi:hypothetical protein
VICPPVTGFHQKGPGAIWPVVSTLAQSATSILMAPNRISPRLSIGLLRLFQMVQSSKVFHKGLFHLDSSQLISRVDF